MLQQVSHSIFVTNFTNSVSVQDLWCTFDQYGKVVDVYIVKGKLKLGRNFGFISFIVTSSNLCMVWLGNLCLRANLEKFKHGDKNVKGKDYQSFNKPAI